MTETRLVGLKEANAAMRKLPPFAQQKAQKEMDTTAFQVMQGARQRVRVLTGFLKDAIQWVSRPRSLRAVVGVLRSAFYWKFLEYGTVKMPAKPFFRPAAEAERNGHHQRLQRALNEAANQVEREYRNNVRFV